MKNYILVLILSVISTHLSASDSNKTNLIGIWAMDPITEIKAGAANVTEYREDGTYTLTAFRCTSETTFLKTQKYDSSGEWRIEGNKIITSPTNLEEKAELNEQFEAVKVMFEKATEEERQNFFKNAPAELVAYIEGKPIESIETIVSLTTSQMRSKQELMPGVQINLKSTKVTALTPNCTNFN